MNKEIMYLKKALLHTIMWFLASFMLNLLSDIVKPLHNSTGSIRIIHNFIEDFSLVGGWICLVIIVIGNLIIFFDYKRY